MFGVLINYPYDQYYNQFVYAYLLLLLKKEEQRKNLVIRRLIG